MREAIAICTAMVVAAPLIALVIGVIVRRFSRRIVVRLGTWFAGAAILAGTTLLILLNAHQRESAGAVIRFAVRWFTLGGESPLVVDLAVQMDIIAATMVTIASLVVFLVLPSAGRRACNVDVGNANTLPASQQHVTRDESMNSQTLVADGTDAARTNEEFSRGGAAPPLTVWLILSLWASTVLLVVSAGFVQLVFFWQLQTIFSCFLIRQTVDSQSNEQGHRTTLLTMYLGDIPFFVAFCMLWEHFGSFDFSQVLTGIDSSDVRPAAIGGICVCLFAPILTRCAQFPFSLWVGQASSIDGFVSAVLHAGLFMPAGVFLAIRVQPLFASATQPLALLAIVGTLSALLGAAMAAAQPDLRRAISVLSVCHFGLILIAVAYKAIAAALFLVAIHAPAKAALMLVLDTVTSRSDKDSITASYGGWRRVSPIPAVAFAYCAVLLCVCFSVVGSVGDLEIGNPSDESVSAHVVSGLPDSQPQAAGTEAVHISRPSPTRQMTAGALFWLTNAALFLSALSMFRVYFLVFFRDDLDGSQPVERHEGFHSRVPLIVAIATATAFVAAAIGQFDSIGSSITTATQSQPNVSSFSFESFGVNLLSGMLGIAVATTLYMRPSSWPQQIESVFAPFARLSRHSFYLRECGNLLVARPVELISMFMRTLDEFVIQRMFVHSFVAIPSWFNSAMRPLQVGGTSTYILSSCLAVAVLLIVSLYLMG